MAHDQFIEPSDTPGHWASLFMFNTATTKIINATYLISVVGGSLHVVSLIISVYLTILFRKISRLPPDMNPLEDNLTSRHKRNKSEMIDNRTSQASTAITSKRDSRVEEPLIPAARSVPFMHTRYESSMDINKIPRPHFSPRASYTNAPAPFYDQSLSNRSSRTNTRPNTFHEQPLSQHMSKADFNPNNSLNISTVDESTHNEPTLLRSPTKSSSIYTDDVTSRPTSTRPASTRPPSTRPLSTAPSLPPTAEDADNWITHPTPPPSPPIEFKHLRNSNPYLPLPQSSSPYKNENIENFVPRPLEMNPPTPVNARYDQQQQRGVGAVRGAATTIDQRALMPGTGNTLGLRGPLDFNPQTKRESRQPQQQQRLGDGYGELRNEKRRDDGFGNRNGNGNGNANRYYNSRNGSANGLVRGGRVISRSGVEITGGQGMGRGMRSREVSGKRVEEGRSSQVPGWGIAR
ncbi:MAG: hypothetical protein Q9220_003691 [cf. Caloplaca sp. 1 TL-2023]